MMQILSIPFSILAYAWYIFILLIFHPAQWFTYFFFGYQAHKTCVDIMNFFLLRTIHFLFSYSEIENSTLLPLNKPLIFVANHQGIIDINGMAWHLRKFHPKFVSKIELGKRIPSISFNLRYGGSVLIDRKNPRQALPELKKMGEYIQQYNRSTIIYPPDFRAINVKSRFIRRIYHIISIICKFE